MTVTEREPQPPESRLDAHRRRREAALRLPPLHDGRRDPLCWREIADGRPR